MGLNTSDDVFALVRESPGNVAVSLVNMTDIQSEKWNEPAEYPKQTGQITLTIRGFDQKVKRAFLSSPDEPTFSLEPVQFQQEGDRVTLDIPSLKIWDLVVFSY